LVGKRGCLSSDSTQPLGSARLGPCLDTSLLLVIGSLQDIAPPSSTVASQPSELPCHSHLVSIIQGCDRLDTSEIWMLKLWFVCVQPLPLLAVEYGSQPMPKKEVRNDRAEGAQDLLISYTSQVLQSTEPSR
jgi:hypothetical protein